MITPKFDIAGVIAQALGGLNSGFGQVQQRQRQQQQDQLQQQQFQLDQKQFGLQNDEFGLRRQQDARAQQQMAFNTVVQQLGLLDPDMEAGPGLIGEAAKYGLAGMFYKDPTTGVFKRRMTQQEQMKLAEQNAQTTAAQVKLGQQQRDAAQQQEMLNPQWGEQLMRMPMEQRTAYLLARGFHGNDVPTSLAEDHQRAMVNPSVISAGIRNQQQGQKPAYTQKDVLTAARQLWSDANPGQYGVKPAMTMDNLAPYLTQAQKLLDGEMPEVAPVEVPKPEEPQLGLLERIGNLFRRDGGQKSGQPRLQAQTPSTPMSFTMAEIQQQAQEDGVPVEQLIKEAKDAGYTITR